MKRLLIFGSGSFAKLIKDYLIKDYNIVGFVTTEHDEHLDWDGIENKYPPKNYNMFIAVGYSKNNKIRERFINEAKIKGYDLISYYHPSNLIGSNFKMGENCFMFERNTIQPNVTLEDGVIVWSNNVISHDTLVGKFSFIVSGCVIAGHVTIECNSFLGIGCLVRNRVTIPSYSFVKMGSRVI